MQANDNRPAWWWVTGLTFVAILALLDLLMDLRTGAELTHVAFETGIVVLLGAISVAMWRARGKHIVSLNQEVHSRNQQIRELDAEVGRWRAENEELLRGLGQAIDLQFERWQLTAAEAEVALLLLKGLSLKEVGSVRNTSERTSRDQARAVYKKSDLSGRSELSAFFLEDLLLPQNKHAA